jgi:hypothetical protein
MAGNLAGRFPDLRMPARSFWDHSDVPAALLAASSSSSSGFSAPLLIAAGAAGIAWVAVLLVVVAIRHAPRVAAGPERGLAPPPEPPAVAGLLCDDFVVGAEAAAATLLDLAARRVVVLEEVQPGHTICRLRDRGGVELSRYDRMVLDQLRRRALDGVVPTDALTTGTDDVSRAWHRDFARQVVRDAKARGLTRDRRPTHLVTLLGSGALVVLAFAFAAGAVGGDPKGDVDGVTAAAGVVAFLSIPIGAAIVARLGRSLAQLPTEQGRAAAASARALQRTFQEQGSFNDLPPAAVVLWDRLFAYAAAMGAARRAVTMLALGAEDDHRAWSSVGGRWRRVRVRYPRAWPPGWGKHPGVAVLLAVVWGGAAAVAIAWLADVAGEGRDRSLGFDQSTYDWIGRIALVGIGVASLVVLWALWVLARAVPDLWSHRTVTGEIVRDRRRPQVVASGNQTKYWYYLAVDDGTSDHIRAWRVRAPLWQQCHQGERVQAEVTPGLGYVRSIVAAPDPDAPVPAPGTSGSVTG